MNIPYTGSVVRRTKHVLSGLGLGAVLLSPLAHATSYNFTTVSMPGASLTYVLGINDNGTIVGDYQNSSGGYSAFLDNNGSYTTFTVPFAGAIDTQAYGINNNGDIVGIYVDSSGIHSFLDNGGVFTTLNVPGGSFTRALGINNNGAIVGTFSNGSGIFSSFLATPVPEARTWIMMLAGIGLIGLRRRRYG